MDNSNTKLNDHDTESSTVEDIKIEANRLVNEGEYFEAMKKYTQAGNIYRDRNSINKAFKCYCDAFQYHDRQMASLESYYTPVIEMLEGLCKLRIEMGDLEYCIQYFRVMAKMYLRRKMIEPIDNKLCREYEHMKKSSPLPAQYFNHYITLNQVMDWFEENSKSHFGENSRQVRNFFKKVAQVYTDDGEKHNAMIIYDRINTL